MGALPHRFVYLMTLRVFYQRSVPVKCAVIILLLLATFTLAEAQPRVDLEKERLELLQVHKADREAHFKKMWTCFS